MRVLYTGRMFNIDQCNEVGINWNTAMSVLHMLVVCSIWTNVMRWALIGILLMRVLHTGCMFNIDQCNEVGINWNTSKSMVYIPM